MLIKFKEKQGEREQGFTLIELLVVILIIGILVAIAIPAFLNQRKSAKDTALESDLTNAGTAMWSFKATEKKLGNQAVPATLPQSYLPLSKGTVLANSGTFDAFCIIGTNEGSNHTANGKDIPMAYDSTLGGLLTDGPVEGGACDASNLAPVPAPSESESGAYPPYDNEKCHPSSLIVGQKATFAYEAQLWEGSRWVGSAPATVIATYKGSVVEGSFCYYDWDIAVSLDDKTISGVTDWRPTVWFSNNRGRSASTTVTVSNGEASFMVREEASINEDYDSWDSANAVPTRLDDFSVVQ